MVDSDESVLILSQYFPPETGAAQTRWKELSERWAEDVSVTVITSAPDYPEGEIYDGYENKWVRKEEQSGINIIYTKTITSSSGNLLRRSLKFAWFMLISLIVGLRYTSPSIVVATSPQPLTGVSGWLISRIRGATFGFEVRDLWPESVTAVSDFDNRLVIWCIDRIVAFLYHRADTIIVVSRAFIEPIVDQGVDRSKIIYHPNGINPDDYRVEGTRHETKATDDTFTVSYVGTIGRAHGLSVVLEAAPELEEVEFIIVGDGSERERLEDKANSLDNVTFVGRQPKSEVPHYLADSDAALVHLKPREIFETVIPSKMLEAMAAGLPVILGVEGEAARILNEADAGIPIEPGSAQELIAAVEDLRNHKNVHHRYSENGRRFVSEEFHWDRISEGYLSDLRKTDS